MLLEGDGVRLRSADGAIDHRLDTPLAPFAFGGDEPIDCTLLGGPSADFNVMSRRARGRAGLRVFDEPTRLARAAHGLLLSAAGSWRVGGGRLTAGQGVWWADQVEQWRAAPASRGARLIAVHWERAAEI